MNVTSKLKKTVQDPLQSFKILQRIIAVVCISIPLLLKVSDRDAYYPASVLLLNETEMTQRLDSADTAYLNAARNARLHTELKLTYCDSAMSIVASGKICKDDRGFRLSISDYAYSSNSYLFGLLYTMAALLFIYNGVVHMKNKDLLDLQRKGNWFNVMIGLCLIGVILNPQSHSPLLHNLFSILFFVANIGVMLFVPKQRETPAFKRARMAMAILCVLVFIGPLEGVKWYTLLWAEWASLFLIASYLILLTVYVKRCS